MDKIIVKIKNGIWECKEDKNLQDMLNLRYNSNEISFYSPWIDFELAEMAKKEIKNIEVILPDKPKLIKGRVY